MNGQIVLIFLKFISTLIKIKTFCKFNKQMDKNLHFRLNYTNLN